MMVALVNNPELYTLINLEGYNVILNIYLFIFSTQDGRETVWPHDPHTGWSYCVTIPSWVVLPKSRDSDPVVVLKSNDSSVFL